MLSVTIPWDRTTARVKIDFVEMEPNAQVTFCNKSFYLFSPYFSGGHSTRPKLALEITGISDAYVLSLRYTLE